MSGYAFCCALTNEAETWHRGRGLAPKAHEQLFKVTSSVLLGLKVMQGSAGLTRSQFA